MSSVDSVDNLFNHDPEINISPIRSFAYVLNTMLTLPEHFVSDFVDNFNDEFDADLLSEIDELSHRISHHLKTCFIDHREGHFEDFTQEQVRNYVGCMTASPKKEDMQNYLESETIPTRDHLLRSFCRGDPEYDGVDDELRRLSRIQDLRELELLQKREVSKGLLYSSCRAEWYDDGEDYSANTHIFHYLVDWDPTALMPNDTLNPFPIVFQDKGEFFCLLNNVFDPEYEIPIATIKMVLKAGLHYFPSKLGFLLNKDNEDETSFSTALSADATYGPKKLLGWTIIEECLEEVGDLKLHRPDPSTNLYPFMYAAIDDSCKHLDLVYYLLRKNPPVLLGLDVCGKVQKGSSSSKKKSITNVLKDRGE